MTNDKPNDEHQALKDAFDELLTKASKEKVHAVCLGDLMKQDEDGNVEGDLIIAGNYAKNVMNRNTIHLLLRALYGIFESGTSEEKEDFLTDFLHFYLLLATDGNEAVMEKVEDILTDVLCKALDDVLMHQQSEEAVSKLPDAWKGKYRKN